MAFRRLEEFENRLRRLSVVDIPRPRLVDRANPMEQYDAGQFRVRFHMTKDTARFIVDLIQEDLCSPIKRGSQLPPLYQFLAVLRFYCTDAFQIVTGDLHAISQPTISKLVKRVSVAIAKQRHLFIKFPTTQEDVNKTRAEFYEIASFPGIRKINN